MDHRHYSPAGLSESELDETCSSNASSPMSIYSAEASSPYDSSRLHGDEDLSPLPLDTSYSASSPSPPTCINNNNDNNDNDQWSTSNPYNNRSKSVRWFRDDRGLWSERSSSHQQRRNSPYQRHPAGIQHKEKSEVLIHAVQRQDAIQLRHLLAKHSDHVNILGQEGDSALHRSCRQGNLDTVKLLVSLNQFELNKC